MTGRSEREESKEGGPGGPRRVEAEAALSKEFEPAAIDNLTIDPADLIADAHAAQTYRAHLVSVMTKRAVTAINR